MVLNALQSCSGKNECMGAQNWELFNITRDSLPGREKRKLQNGRQQKLQLFMTAPVSDALA